jgi:putative membrane protein
MKRSWGRWTVLGAMVMAMGVGAQPQQPPQKQPHHKMDPKADQAERTSRMMVGDGVPAFLAQLRAINETEIALGELTQQRASNPAVKQYGEHMVQDHRKADQQLLDFAKQRGIQLPPRVQPTNEVQNRLLSATEATKAKLWVLDSPLYDQAYLASQVANHDEALQLVTLARQQYPDLAPLLDGLLPTLREHRDQAYQLLGQSPPAQRQARPPAGERR